MNTKSDEVENKNSGCGEAQNQCVVMRPGRGWTHIGGPVYEHSSGARVHTGGLVKMPNGDYYHINKWPQGYSIRAAIKINGGNRKRGMMAWAANAVGA